MDRRQLHEFLSEYFPNSKHLLFEIFPVSDEEIKRKALNLRGYKIPIKLSGTYVKVRMLRTGLNDTNFYNGFLEVLKDRYTKDQIKEEIERWKTGILQFAS